MSAKYYAGIGSRKTPTTIQTLMIEIAKKLCDKDMILRSGGADGADQAFERGVDYWYTYLHLSIKEPIPKEIFYAGDIDKSAEFGNLAMKEAQKYHPVWWRLSPFIRKLHARNVFQILGRDLKSPVSFVLCWTPDGCITHQSRTINTGGTGTALSVANMHGIPIFNLARPEHLTRIRQGLNI